MPSKLKLDMQTDPNLLHHESNLEIDYTDEPTGDAPDLDRQTNGEAPFPVVSLKTNAIRKTIIISDPALLEQFSEYDSEYIRKQYMNLIAVMIDGQSICFWNGETLTHYDKRNDPLGYNFLCSLTQLPKESDTREIEAAAVPHGILPDYIYHLNDEAAYKTLFSKYLDDQAEEEENETEADEPFYLQQILKNAETSNPDAGSQEKMIDMTTEEFAENADAELLQVEATLIALKNKPLTESDLPELPKLRILGIESARVKDIAAILNRAPNLTNLDLTSIHDEDDFSEGALQTLFYLETLLIENASLSFKFLAKLLHACPNLKNLVVKANIGERDSAVSLPHLPHLHYVDCSERGAAVLSELITPATTMLVLSNVTPDIVARMDEAQLSGIRTVQLSEPDSEALPELLRMLPANLEILQCDSYIITEEEIAPELERFTRLKAHNIKWQLAGALDKSGELPDDSKEKSKQSVSPTSVKKTCQKAFTNDGRPKVATLPFNDQTGDALSESIESPILFKTHDPDLNNPGLYRLNVISRFTDDLKPINEFHWQPFREYAYTTDLEKKFDEEKNRNHAFSSLELAPNGKKQILFSLSPNEKLTDIEITSADPSAKVAIFYDKKTRLYAVDVQSKNPVQFHYQIDVNRLLYTEKKDLDVKIKNIINEFAGYVSKEIKLDKPLTGRALLQEIKRQRVGACRHRAIACYDELTRAGFESCVATNAGHAFIEVTTPDGQVLTADLGGSMVGEQKNIPYQSGRKMKPVALAETSKTAAVDVSEFKDYERPPMTLTDRSTEEFFTDLFRKEKKPLLLLTDDVNQLHGLVYSAGELKRDYCFIDDLDYFKKPATHAFLKKTEQTSGQEAILFVRWDKNKVTRSEHVGLNSLFEVPPKWEGKLLPKNLRVVALAEHTTQLSDDVSSRFQSRMFRIPDTLQVPSGDEAKMNTERKTETKEGEWFNLYSSLDWEKMLIGYTVYENGETHFIPGKLLEMIQKKGADPVQLNLINPPWHLPEFNVFWNQLLLQGRFFAHDRFYNLPPNFMLPWLSKPFTQPKHVRFAALDEINRHEWSHVLNQSTFKRFFSQIVDKNKKLNTVPGLLETAERKEIPVFVTEKLLDGQWEQLFDKAASLGKKLKFIVAPNVELPAKIKLALGQPVNFKLKNSPVTCLTGNDPDFVARTSKNHVVLTVSPDSTYNLVEHWHSDGDEKKTAYVNDEGVLFSLLKAGKDVVLTGHLSERLVSRLQTLFADPPYLEFNGKRYELGPDKVLKGKLKIVTEKNHFPFANMEHKPISAGDYWEKIDSSDRYKRPMIDELCKQLDIKIQSLSRLEDIFDNMRVNPDKNPLEWLLLLKPHPENWLAKGQALYEKYSRIYYPARDYKKEAKSGDEMTARLREMNARLREKPLLCLLGPSGTGKSTLILQKLEPFYKARGKDVRIFATSPPAIEGVLDWAKCQDGGDKTMKFLFIDEANLASEETYAFLQGMMKEPPEIIYRGERIRLTENHKVIFAGNYQHYEKRRLHDILVKQDCVMHFPAFSPEYVNKTQVLPVIQSAFNESKSAESDAKLVLDIFLQATEMTKKLKKNVNLTVRNLQSMALAFETLWGKPQLLSEQARSEKIKTMAKWVFYQNARDVLNVKESNVLKSQLFGIQYELLKKQFPRVARQELGDMHITGIHKRALAVLQEEMQIRELRCGKLQSVGLSSGTSGMMLGGEPGIGKSSMVINYLRESGFKQADEKTETKAGEVAKVYYHLTLTNPREMKKTLLKAFHEGAVVVIDEINTLPIESLLNSLMMGVDNKGKPAARKGFYVIGTYNPVGSGRQKLSEATENRFRNVTMPAFSEDDLNKFLLQKFKAVPESVRHYFSAKYRTATLRKASYHFRNLLSDMEYAKERAEAKSLIRVKEARSKAPTEELAPPVSVLLAHLKR